MPFTPFHAGLALAVKPLAARHFSFTAFCVAQIVMDIEPLIGLKSGLAVLHGITHTFIAAFIIALPCAAIASFIRRPIVRRFNREAAYYNLAWLSEPAELSRAARFNGALSGTLSHVVLDSLMHLDIRPFAPFSDANPFLGHFSHEGVYLFCTVAAITGGSGWIAAKWRRGRTSAR